MPENERRRRRPFFLNIATKIARAKTTTVEVSTSQPPIRDETIVVVEQTDTRSPQQILFENTFITQESMLLRAVQLRDERGVITTPDDLDALVGSFNSFGAGRRSELVGPDKIGTIYVQEYTVNGLNHAINYLDGRLEEGLNLVVNNVAIRRKDSLKMQIAILTNPPEPAA